MGHAILGRLYSSRNCRLASYVVILCPGLEREGGNYESLWPCSGVRWTDPANDPGGRHQCLIQIRLPIFLAGHRQMKKICRLVVHLRAEKVQESPDTC